MPHLLPSQLFFSHHDLSNLKVLALGCHSNVISIPQRARRRGTSPAHPRRLCHLQSCSESRSLKDLKRHSPPLAALIMTANVFQANFGHSLQSFRFNRFNLIFIGAAAGWLKPVQHTEAITARFCHSVVTPHHKIAMAT